MGGVVFGQKAGSRKGKSHLNMTGRSQVTERLRMSCVKGLSVEGWTRGCEEGEEIVKD